MSILESSIYNHLVNEHNQLATCPINNFTEGYTYFNIVGNLSQKSVLDLGCGSGAHCRRFSNSGASRVIGVDIADKMIDVAQKKEQLQAQGINYHVMDITRQQKEFPSFDLITASYLLDNARSKSELLEMMKFAAKQLKSTGRFLALVPNGDADIRLYNNPNLKKYNIYMHAPSKLIDATPYDITFLWQGRFTVTVYYYLLSTYKQLLLEAGFKEIKIHFVGVSPQGMAQKGADFWQEFIDYKPYIIIEAEIF